MSPCIIFDLDGTLVDSEGLCNQALLDLLPGVQDDKDELVRRYRGARLSTILADLSTRLGVDIPTNFEMRYRARVATLFENGLKPVAGAVEMLDALPYPSCVASGGPISKIRHSLKISGLAPFFDDRLYSSYEIGSWKPEPDLFLHAARCMGFPPQQCVVVEDSDVGIQAAESAKMPVIHYNPDAPASGNAPHLSIRDLRELPGVLAIFERSD